jgi:uncharacterized delta-60 repeat protein
MARPQTLRAGRRIGLPALAIVLSLLEARAAEPPDLQVTVPSPGTVSIAIGSASGPGALTVRPDGSMIVAATTISDNPRRGNLVRFSLTSTGALAAHAVGQIGDVAPHEFADATITSNGDVIVVGDAYAPEVVNSQYGGGALAFLTARLLPDAKLDTGFAGSGWMLTDVGGRKNHNIAHSTAVQSDGKILVAGNSLVRYKLIMSAYSFATVRFSIDGSLDKSFGDDGRVITRMGTSREDDARVVLALPDGRITVVGTADTRQNVHCEGKTLDCLQAARTDFALARYLTNGKLDGAFGRNGRAGPIGLGLESAAYAATVDAQQRVIVAGTVTLAYRRPGNRGSQAPAVARYTMSGDRDQTFGTGGVVQLQADGAFGRILALAAQADGKIIAVGHLNGGKCGSCSAAIRLNADGSPDKEFGDSGLLALPFDQNPFGGRGIALQEDGKFVLAGQRKLGGNGGYAIVVSRMNANGTPDPTFGAATAR